MKESADGAKSLVVGLLGLSLLGIGGQAADETSSPVRLHRAVKLDPLMAPAASPGTPHRSHLRISSALLVLNLLPVNRTGSARGFP